MSALWGRLIVAAVVLIPDVVVLMASAPSDAFRSLDPDIQAALEERRAERSARYNRRDGAGERRVPRPEPFREVPDSVIVAGGGSVRPPEVALAAAGGAEVPQEERGAGGLAELPAVLVPPSVAADAAIASAAALAPPGRAWLEGEVHQPDGSPVPCLEARLRVADGSIVASTVTDGAGGYRFADLGAGSYRLEFGPAAARIGRLEEMVEIGRGEHRRDWRSPRLGGIEVAVRSAGDTRPQPGRQVRLQERFGAELEGVTDEEGLARFRNLPVGSYRVLLFENGVRIAEKHQAVVAKATPRVELDV